MARLRIAALSFTVSLLVSGCYTQLRAPHAQHHYSERHISPNRIWYSHAPVFHLPRYDHHDGWLYGDAYCDIWIDRYCDYHPWFPRFETYIYFGHHRRPGYRQGWYRPPIQLNPRWRYYGPRFEPLSPTIDVKIVVVGKRPRFRRDGFAGGVPRRGVDLVTMRTSGSSVGGPGDGPVESGIVRVTRPEKIKKSLAPVALGGDGLTVDEPTHPVWNKEGSWELWVKNTRPTASLPETPLSSHQERWAGASRNLRSWGPASDVKERPVKRPKLETNWFSPQTDSGRDEPESPGSSERVRKDEWSSEESWSPPKSQKKPGQTWTPAPVTRSEPMREIPRTATVRAETRRRIERAPDPAPTPTRSWSPSRFEKRPQLKPSYASPPKKMRRMREEVRRFLPSNNTRKEQSKLTGKKEEKPSKKTTQKKDKKDREEKRRKSGRRRGM